MEIIITEPGQIAPKEKEKLSKKGYIVIEANDPSKVKLMTPDILLVSGGDLCMAALKGVNDGDSNGRRSFFQELYKRAVENESK